MTNRYLILPTRDDQIRMTGFVFVVRLNDLFEPADSAVPECVLEKTLVSQGRF